MVKYIANIITSTRLLGAIILLFIPYLSKPFFVIYTYCGLSDILDGYVARKTNSTSSLGSKLDSASDLLLFGTTIYRSWPILLKRLPRIMTDGILLAILLRLLLYVYYYIKNKQFLSTHSYFNKITSFLICLLPYMLMSNYLYAYILVVLLSAFLAIIDEFIKIK